MSDVHAERRARVLERLGPRAVLVLASPPERLRNGDTHYRFRQDSDILYLTGFEEPGVVLVLRAGVPAPYVMFLRPRNPADEVWTGRRVGVEGATSQLGASLAHPIDELDARLPDLLDGADELHFHFGRDPELDERLIRSVARLRAGERRGRRAPQRLVDARTSAHELRLLKSPQELALLRRAAEITAEAHVEAMKASRPGAYEHEIEAIVDFTFRRRGGTGPGYPTIVGAGRNATILHYVENSARLEAGQLLLVDAGCEVPGGFTADVTRTWPIGGRFSEPQRRVYQAVLDAQRAAIAAVRPGETVDGIHALVIEHLTRSMVQLGLLRGHVGELVRDEKYKAFYMHRTSHWLGIDVHDAGTYAVAGLPRPLAPGMVLTIEPGLYIGEDADAPAEYRGIGVRIEDDVLVTAAAPEVLTAAVPKEIAELERLTAL